MRSMSYSQDWLFWRMLPLYTLQLHARALSDGTTGQKGREKTRVAVHLFFCVAPAMDVRLAGVMNSRFCLHLRYSCPPLVQQLQKTLGDQVLVFGQVVMLTRIPRQVIKFDIRVRLIGY